MDNEPEVIRHQMEETRTSLQDKLETLEQQVKDTVQGATEAVTDTVETVKETIKETVESVKGTVDDTVSSVKETFNLSKHVEDYPWSAFACATAVGFVGTKLMSRSMGFDGNFMGRSRGGVPEAPPQPEYSSSPAYDGGSYRSQSYSPPPEPAAPRSRGLWGWIADHYSGELDKLKGLAIATGAGIIREVLTANVAPEIGERIGQVVDEMTTKLGAEPIKGPILGLNPNHGEQKENQPEQGFAGNRERPVGAGQR